MTKQEKIHRGKLSKASSVIAKSVRNAKLNGQRHVRIRLTCDHSDARTIASWIARKSNVLATEVRLISRIGDVSIYQFNFDQSQS